MTAIDASDPFEHWDADADSAEPDCRLRLAALASLAPSIVPVAGEYSVRAPLWSCLTVQAHVDETARATQASPAPASPEPPAPGHEDVLQALRDELRPLRAAFASLSRQSRDVSARLADLHEIVRQSEQERTHLDAKGRARDSDLDEACRRLASAEADARTMRTERDAASSARVAAEAALASRDNAMTVRTVLARRC